MHRACVLLSLMARHGPGELHVFVGCEGGRYFVDPGPPDQDGKKPNGEGGDALTVPQVFLAIALGPVVLSTCIRVAVMDPLLFFAQADWNDFDLSGGSPALGSQVAFSLSGATASLKSKALLRPSRVHHADHQRTEIAEKLEHSEKRMKYEMRIGRAPKLTHTELEV